MNVVKKEEAKSTFVSGLYHRFRASQATRSSRHSLVLVLQTSLVDPGRIMSRNARLTSSNQRRSVCLSVCSVLLVLILSLSFNQSVSAQSDTQDYIIPRGVSPKGKHPQTTFIPSSSLSLSLFSYLFLSSPSSPSPSTDAHLFQPQPSSSNQFKCLDSKELIPIGAVNDDYCDCKDGSDEPGTSACSDRINLNGTGNGPKGFWCENKGHLQSWILNSRVNDGICGEWLKEERKCGVR